MCFWIESNPFIHNEKVIYPPIGNTYSSIMILLNFLSMVALFSVSSYIDNSIEIKYPDKLKEKLKEEETQS
ncbi:hypothetical protein COU57_03595 [Candidatus Pacearchaeota archaeon CG10_big_fil_rev_8_21_14_0_10_32_14]|nr:MAG: hypothetical protein COU57_03595 [Candidatus Pacearchaeota archaeon CG10_big_fil_rev_8_21_14_0_10_32_14]